MLPVLLAPYSGLGRAGVGWDWAGLQLAWVGSDRVGLGLGLAWGWVGLAVFFQAGYFSVRATISGSGHEFFIFLSGSAVRQSNLLVIVLSREDFCRVRWPEQQPRPLQLITAVLHSRSQCSAVAVTQRDVDAPASAPAPEAADGLPAVPAAAGAGSC